MERLTRFNRSRAASLLVLAAVFLLLFFCNHETDLVADDYRYCFSFSDGSRVESAAQIFPSMASHRQTMNGRVFAHFLVQLFLMWPKTVFDLVNALFFVSLLALICRLAAPNGERNALLLLTVFGCIWLLQPDFGQVMLWLTGSVNYLWCAVFCLLWLLPWARRYLMDRTPAKAAQFLILLFSFPMGAYSENATVVLVAAALAFLLLMRLEKRRLEPWMLFSLLLVLGGFFYMMLAPAESANKSAEFRLPVLWANLLENLRYYIRFWPLLLSYVLFYLLSVQKGIDRRLRLLSLVFLFGSAAGHLVLTFAMYTAGRSTCIGLILLLAANVVLFTALYETGSRRLPAALCALCLVFTAAKVWIGVTDIRQTHFLLQYNEDFLAACAANGERTVEIPRPYARTHYSALEGLPYLNVDDPTDWPNLYMAKYYGLDSVTTE